jgi:tetratricopeptide (TPR) repeat protein
VRSPAAIGLLAVFGLVACAAREARPADVREVDTTVVEVPPSAGGAEPEAGESPPRTIAGGDFDGCAATLREARDVSATDDARAIYDAALAAERASDWKAARVSYYELVSKYPDSGLVPLAYLAFGELFAEEAERDPSKLALAKAAYDQVLRYPAPRNTAYAYALLRQATTEPDGPRALAGFAKTLDATRNYASLPCATLVRERAIAGTTRVYVEVGRPDRAAQFLRTKLDSGELESALSMLADEYVSAGKTSDACTLLRGAENVSALAEKQRKICGKQ